MARYDIKRKTLTADNFLGGQTITFSAIATEDIDLQPLVGREPLEERTYNITLRPEALSQVGL